LPVFLVGGAHRDAFLLGGIRGTRPTLVPLLILFVTDEVLSAVTLPIICLLERQEQLPLVFVFERFVLGFVFVVVGGVVVGAGEVDLLVDVDDAPGEVQGLVWVRELMRVLGDDASEDSRLLFLRGLLDGTDELAARLQGVMAVSEAILAFRGGLRLRFQ